MNRVSMKAKKRPIKTKSFLKQLRNKGNIPGVIYGKHIKESIPVYVNRSEFVKFLHHHHWENTIIDLEVEEEDGSKESYVVLVQEISHNPVSDEISHIDFHHISMTEKIHLRVPVVGVGEAIGIRKGGVLEQMVWEIDIECLPTNIPEEIKVDISNLDIGDSVHVSQVIPPEGVRILESGDTVLFVVEYSGSGEEQSSEESENEPEVIKKGKEEEEK